MRKPRGKCTPYAFFLNICREKCAKKLSREVDFKTLSDICWGKWNCMTEYQKRRFVQMSEYDEVRYCREMTEYNRNRNAYYNQRHRNHGPFSEQEDVQLLNVLNMFDT